MVAGVSVRCANPCDLAGEEVDVRMKCEHITFVLHPMLNEDNRVAGYLKVCKRCGKHLGTIAVEDDV